MAKPTTLAYNARGELLSSTNALTQTTTLAYDTSGYLQSVTGPVSGDWYLGPLGSWPDKAVPNIGEMRAGSRALPH